VQGIVWSVNENVFLSGMAMQIDEGDYLLERVG